MIVPACKTCCLDSKPDITGEKDEDILNIKIGCLMCLFGTKVVITKLEIRQEEIEEILF